MLVKHLSCWHYNPRSDSHNFRDDDHLGQDGAVLDEGVVVGGRLLVDDCHDPLQNRMLQLKITLRRRKMRLMRCMWRRITLVVVVVMVATGGGGRGLCE